MQFRSFKIAILSDICMSVVSVIVLLFASTGLQTKEASFWGPFAWVHSMLCVCVCDVSLAWRPHISISTPAIPCCSFVICKPHKFWWWLAVRENRGSWPLSMWVRLSPVLDCMYPCFLIKYPSHNFRHSSSSTAVCLCLSVRLHCRAVEKLLNTVTPDLSF